MTRTFVLSVMVPFLILCACGTGKQKTEENEGTDLTKPIVAAMERDMPGYFIVGGERYGYPYELLMAYAAERGRDFQLLTGLCESALQKNLESGQTDIVVSLSADTDSEGTISLPLYSTTYVVLVSKKNSAIYSGNNDALSGLFDNRMVMASAGFEATKSYDRLLDSLSSSTLFYISSRGGFELARSLASNEFDMLICEKSEALLAEDLLHNIVPVYEFEEQVPVSLVFSSADRWLCRDFTEWIAEYRQTKDFASLASVYLEKGFGSQLRRINAPNRVVGGISVWDDLVREVGTREGVDWRLLSAIAYNESRFYPEVESHMGAKGMMQIMPVTAQFFKMEDHNLNDPRTSLTIAAKLLKTIDNMLEFTAETSEDDRLSITLAAYNCGIGYVMDARKLASIYEEDRDLWHTVSKYLVLMGDDSFSPENVNYRTFRGSGETLAFVSNVINKFDVYRASVQ